VVLARQHSFEDWQAHQHLSTPSYFSLVYDTICANSCQPIDNLSFRVLSTRKENQRIYIHNFVKMGIKQGNPLGFLV